jgi:hypothetical protein
VNENRLFAAPAAIAKAKRLRECPPQFLRRIRRLS